MSLGVAKGLEKDVNYNQGSQIWMKSLIFESFLPSLGAHQHLYSPSLKSSIGTFLKILNLLKKDEDSYYIGTYERNVLLDITNTT